MRSSRADARPIPTPRSRTSNRVVAPSAPRCTSSVTDLATSAADASNAFRSNTSSDCSSIYAVQFGFQTGICGLDNGGIQVQPLGALETKDAWRTRIKWYCGLALFRATALARLEGVRV